jgi:U3 small nucleolar RNA-associated protein 10
MKTRSETPITRRAAIRVMKGLYERLGEQLLGLLPETIPFIAELMEDTDAQTKSMCEDLISCIESHLGNESISSYL